MTPKEQALEAYRKFKSEPINPDLSPETRKLVEGFHQLADTLVAMIQKREEAERSQETPSANPEKRTCNRHSDCDEADRLARERGARAASHCHDDCCEECFGS